MNIYMNQEFLASSAGLKLILLGKKDGVNTDSEQLQGISIAKMMR